MSIEFAVPMTILITLVLYRAIAHILRDRQLRLQQEIAHRGAFCQGKVVAVQRPFLLDAQTRLYFEFVPSESNDVVLCCHIHRDTEEGLWASLPAAGTTVTVRYLPERPERAMIGRLVSRLVEA